MFLIDRSAKESEFDTQAFLFIELRSRGYKVRGELRGRCSRTGVPLRLDLAIFDSEDSGRIAWAIEVKPTRRKRWKVDFERQKQFRNYGGLEIPVIIICGMEEACQFLEALTEPPCINGCHWWNKS